MKWQAIKVRLGDWAKDKAEWDKARAGELWDDWHELFLLTLAIALAVLCAVVISCDPLNPPPPVYTATPTNTYVPTIATPSATLRASITQAPTLGVTPTWTSEPSATRTLTPSQTSTMTATDLPTSTFVATGTPSKSVTPSQTPTNSPTITTITTTPTPEELIPTAGEEMPTRIMAGELREDQIPYPFVLIECEVYEWSVWTYNGRAYTEWWCAVPKNVTPTPDGDTF